MSGNQMPTVPGPGLVSTSLSEFSFPKTMTFIFLCSGFLLLISYFLVFRLCVKSLKKNVASHCLKRSSDIWRSQAKLKKWGGQGMKLKFVVVSLTSRLRKYGRALCFTSHVSCNAEVSCSLSSKERLICQHI